MWAELNIFAFSAICIKYCTQFPHEKLCSGNASELQYDRRVSSSMLTFDYTSSCAERLESYLFI